MTKLGVSFPLQLSKQFQMESKAYYFLGLRKWNDWHTAQHRAMDLGQKSRCSDCQPEVLCTKRSTTGHWLQV